jgi:hypothetical protein
MGTIPTTSLPKVENQESDSSAVLRHDTRARFVMGVLIIAQFVLLVAYVEFTEKELPDAQLIIGAEISFVSIVLNYFFGSSSGSVTKSASASTSNGQTTKQTLSSP